MCHFVCKSGIRVSVGIIVQVYFQVHVFLGACISRCLYFQVHVLLGVCISMCMYFQVFVFLGACISRCLSRCMSVPSLSVCFGVFCKGVCLSRCMYVDVQGVPRYMFVSVHVCLCVGVPSVCLSGCVSVFFLNPLELRYDLSHL